MKFICLFVINILLQGLISNVYPQSNNIVVKAWAIDEEISGGAPPPEFQKPLFRKSIRFFMETIPNYKVKIICIYVGETPFAVLEEHQDKSFLNRDYKPSDFNVKNNFIQVLVTDTLRSNCLKIPTDLIKQNQAVIVYSINKKKQYYLPIKTVVHERINLP